MQKKKNMKMSNMLIDKHNGAKMLEETILLLFLKKIIVLDKIILI